MISEVPLSNRPLPSLKRRTDFLALRRETRFTCPPFVMQGYLAFDGKSLPEVGYTVTKKTGNSVERNRIKRRLRAAVAEAMQQATRKVEQRQGDTVEQLDGKVVIIARRCVLSEHYDSLVANLAKGIDRLVSKGKKAS